MASRFSNRFPRPRRPFRWQAVLLGVVMACGAYSTGYARNLFRNLIGKSSKREPAAAAERKVTPSKYFFDFAECAYYTSPDKRIGVKMLIDTARVGPSMTSMHHLTLLPGARSLPHRHVFGTSLLYVLKGTLAIRIEDERKLLGPQTAAFIPPKAVHEYRNESGDVVELIEVFAPAGPEEEYRNWEKTGGAQEPGAKSATAGGAASGSGSPEVSPAPAAGASPAGKSASPAAPPPAPTPTVAAPAARAKPGTR